MAQESTAQLGILVTLRDQATDAMRRMSNTVSDLGGSLGFAGDKSGILASGLAAIGGSTIMGAIAAFNEAQEKLDKAKGILSQFPDGMAKFTQAVEAGNEAQRRFGFDNDTATLGIARLANAAGGDMTKALMAFQAAMGLAVDKNMDLDSAIAAILPTFAGGGRALKSLGFDIDEHASAETAFQKVIAATATELEAYGKSATTQGKIIKAGLGEVLETMGKPFANIINGLAGMTNGTIDLTSAASSLDPWIQGLGISLGGLSAYIAAVNAPAMLTRLLVTMGLLEAGATVTAGSIALVAGSFLLWLVVIAAIVGSLIYLVSNWEQHWDNIKWAAGVARDYIKGVLEKIVQWFQQLPEIIGAAIGTLVVSVMKGFEALGGYLLAKVPEIVGNIVTWFAGLPSRIVGALASLPSRITDFFRSSIDQIKGLFDGLVSYITSIPARVASFGTDLVNNGAGIINRFIDSFNSVPGLPDFLKIPKIPKLAAGGIVTEPTLAIIGEAGPEAVIPLGRGGGGVGGSINIFLNGTFYTTTEIAEEFANEIARIIKNQLNVPMRA